MRTEFVSCVVLSRATRVFRQVFQFSSLSKNQHCEELCMINQINVHRGSECECLQMNNQCDMWICCSEKDIIIIIIIILATIQMPPKLHGC